MYNIRRIVFAFGYILGSVIGLLTCNVTAQTLDPQIDAEIQSSIDQLNTVLKKAGKDFENVNGLLTLLQKRISRLQGEFFELQSKSTILKKDKNTADLLEGKLKEIDAQLNDIEGRRQAVIDELVALYNTVAKIRVKETNNAHGFLLDLVTTLTAQIGKAHIAKYEKLLETSDPKSLLKALASFYVQLDQFNDAVGANTINLGITTQMAVLSATLENLGSDLSGIEGAPEAAKKLAILLYENFPKAEVVVAEKKVAPIIVAAKALTKALPTDLPKEKVLRSAIIENPEAVTELIALETALDKIGLQDAGLVVRIVDASYGDTPHQKTRIRSRWCDATIWMRGQCDRKKSCKIEADHNTKACGYDPAPSADPRYRGIYVKYECLPDIESNFTGHYGRLSRRSARHSHPVGSVTDYVIVRSEGHIICAADKEK